MSVFDLKASSGGSGSGDKPPVGNHPAVLIAIVDLGTQKVREYKGDGYKNVHQIHLTWELVTKKKSGSNQNHVIGRAYTLAFNKSENATAGLRLLVEGWAGNDKLFSDGDGFKLQRLLGKPCLLNVKHNDKGYPRIEGVAPVPDGMSVAAPQNKPLCWEIGQGPIPDLSHLPWLFGESIQEAIEQSAEWKKIAGDEEGGGQSDEEEIDAAPPVAAAANGAGKKEIPF